VKEIIWERGECNDEIMYYLLKQREFFVQLLEALNCFQFFCGSCTLNDEYYHCLTSDATITV